MTNFLNGYLAAGSGGAVGAAFSELAIGTYARQPVAFAITGMETVSNANAVTFASPSTSLVAVTQFAVFDADSGGNMIFYWNADAKSFISPSAPLIIAANQVSLDLPDMASATPSPTQWINGQVIGVTQSAARNPVFCGCTALLNGKQGACTVTVQQSSAAFNTPINVLVGYGVSPTNANNLTGMQNAINDAIASGRQLYIPAGRYKYSGTLSITGNITIVGDGVQESTGDFYTTYNAIDFPTLSPALGGTVLCPASNGSNAITITGSGLTVNLRDFGVEFQTPFLGSGHGIYYLPVYQSGSLDYSGGLTGSVWQNIKVFGHDGNHYAFYLVNGINNIFMGTRAFGGGGWFIQNYSGNNGNWGNSTWYHPYVVVMAGGSAHGYSCTSYTTGLTNPGRLNALTMVKPQCNGLSYTGAYTAPASAPTSAQYGFICDTLAYHFNLIAPDFETTQGMLCKLPGPTNGYNGCAVDWTAGTLQMGVQFAANLTSISYLPDGTRVQSFTFATGGATSGTQSLATLGKNFSQLNFCVMLTGIGGAAWLTATPTASSFAWACASGTTSITYFTYGYA